MEKRRIKICHFNGKRGGFGTLIRTLRMIENDPDMELQIVVSDMHVSEKFGFTKDEVSGYFKISAAIDMEQQGGTAADRGEALGKCLAKTTREFEKLQPDALLVLGDRGEVLSAVIAAVNLKIPVLHVEGGDISGSLDEFFRHAITKLAHIHFPATKAYAERIRKLGEEDWRIHIAGDAHIDPVIHKEYNSPSEMRKRYNLESGYLIVLQHPVTTEPEKSGEQMAELMKAVEKTNLETILVYPCSDQGYQGTIDVIERYRGNPKMKIFKNIFAPDFLGLLAGAEAIVGNSSSGIKEAPYLGVPTINVGTRQEGRPKDRTIIDVPEARTEAICTAIRTALEDMDFRKNLSDCQKLYGEGKAAETIVGVIKNLKFDKKLFEKRMSY